MAEWGALGVFILLFVPMLGRLHWGAGIATIVVALLVMILTGNNGIGSLAAAGIVLIGSSIAVIKKTQDWEIIDWFSFASGIILIIISFILVLR